MIAAAGVYVCAHGMRGIDAPAGAGLVGELPCTHTFPAWHPLRVSLEWVKLLLPDLCEALPGELGTGNEEEVASGSKFAEKRRLKDVAIVVFSTATSSFKFSVSLCCISCIINNSVGT